MRARANEHRNQKPPFALRLPRDPLPSALRAPPPPSSSSAARSASSSSSSSSAAAAPAHRSQLAATPPAALARGGGGGGFGSGGKSGPKGVTAMLGDAKADFQAAVGASAPRAACA